MFSQKLVNQIQVAVNYKSPLLKKKLHPTLIATVGKLDFNSITKDRRILLQPLADYLQKKAANKEFINLHFICTHNSRRSQMAQVWAQTAAYYYGIEAHCFSGGVEVTAFNERAVAAIKKAGFKVKSKDVKNPRYHVSFSDDTDPLVLFSKLFNDASSPANNFAAVITCSNADEHCPLIPGAEQRISLLYEDPKAFDDTPEETKRYDERSTQIAAELFYVFSQII